MFCIDFNSFFSWSGWGFVAAMGAIIAAIATVWYTVLTYKIAKATIQSLGLTRESLDLNRQTISHSSKVAEFEIYTKIADALNTTETDELINACENGKLFIDNTMGININVSLQKVEVSGNYLNWKLINLLDDLAKFYSDGLITIESINSGFGYSLLIVGSNNEVRKHLVSVRKQYPDCYKGLEELYSLIHKMSTPEEQKKYKSTLY